MQGPFRTTPEAIEQYRRNSQKMAGATRIPVRAKCIRCEKMRTAATGTATEAGFLCHHCGRVS